MTSDFGRIKVVCRGNKSISTISRRSEKLRGSLGVIRQAHRLKAGIRGLSSATNQLKRFRMPDSPLRLCTYTFIKHGGSQVEVGRYNLFIVSQCKASSHNIT